MKTYYITLALLLHLIAIGTVAGSPYKIVVNKSQRKLCLYRNDSLIKQYTIALGLQPVGKKQKQGDYRTPEGTYYICSKNAHSQFYLSLAVSYPNTSDATQGLTSGLISRSEYQRIHAATTTNQKPPMNTRLGGDIFIHGFGTGRDWTWGCIAMENSDVKELFECIPIGTTIIINP